MFAFRRHFESKTPPEDPVQDGNDHSPTVDIESEVKRLFALLNPRLEQGAGLVLQLIAAQPGEGVSTIARALAQLACQYTEGSVVLLEFDSREGGRPSPKGGHPLRLGPLRPLSDWDIDTSNLMISPRGEQPCRMEFLGVGDSTLVLGRLTENPAGSIYGANAARFWSTLRQKSVLAIVDSSSLPDGLDGAVISRDMDAVFVVVEAEATRSPVVQSLCQKLRLQEAPIAGIILNKRRFYIPARLYRWLSHL